MEKIIFFNKKANLNYKILNQYTAGLKLRGFEVRALKDRKVNLEVAFISFDKNELFLKKTHFPEGQKNNKIFQQRNIKLLLNRRELNEILGQTTKKGVTLAPIRIFLQNNLIKAEIAIVTGKKEYDKREEIKKNDARRQLNRDIKQSFRN